MFFCCPFSCTGKHDGSIPHNNMEHELCQPEQREFSEFKGNYSTEGDNFFTAEKFAMHQAYGTIKLSQFQPFFYTDLFAIWPRIKLHSRRSLPSFQVCTSFRSRDSIVHQSLSFLTCYSTRNTSPSVSQS